MCIKVGSVGLQIFANSGSKYYYLNTILQIFILGPDYNPIYSFHSCIPWSLPIAKFFLHY